MLNEPSRLAPFLAILHGLKPTIQGSGRLLQWWEKLSGSVLEHLGTEKGLAQEAREILLGILVWDEDEDEEPDVNEDKRATAEAFADSLVGTWISISDNALEDVNRKARFIEAQLQHILLAFGRRRPKVFIQTQPYLS